MGIFDEVLRKVDSGEIELGDDLDLLEMLQKAVPGGHDLSPEEHAEIMAFRITEPDTTKGFTWGRCFGPRTSARVDEGERVEKPARKEVTREMVAHWRKRMAEVRHPFLQARYTGLVWDLPGAIWGDKQDSSLRAKYIEATMELVKRDWYKRKSYGVKALERVMMVACAYNNREYFESLKKLLFEYEKRMASRKEPLFWLFTYNLLSRYPKLEPTEAEMNTVIGRLEKKLEELKAASTPGLVTLDVVKDTAMLLAKYYLKKKKMEDVRRVILSVGEAFELASGGMSGLMRQSWREKLCKLYYDHFMNEDAQEMLKQVKAKGKEHLDGMTTMTGEVPITAEMVEAVVNELMEADGEALLHAIFQKFAISRDMTLAELNLFASAAPTMYMFSRKLVDTNGRTVGSVGSLERDLEGNMVLQAKQTLELQALFLSPVLEAGRSRGKINLDGVKAFLRKSSILGEDRLPIIDRAVEAFFADDYMVFLHLIVPQIEEAVRVLVEMTEGVVLKPKGGAFNVKTFDDLLGSESFMQVVGADIQAYCRVLFTDNRGMNVRNIELHGMAAADFFNRGLADRVFHAMLLLGLLRKEDQGAVPMSPVSE